MPLTHPTNCIIYCRVSSKKQMTEGDGLRSQEKRCRDYAAAMNYKVLRVFSEEGVSGGSGTRPAMGEMLSFLGEQSGEVVVVVDDIKRFARDVELHFALKLAIMKRGGRLESPTFRFDDSPEGKFFETLMAAQAELERNQNKRQVFNRTQARLEQGFWTFRLPPGYKYVKHPIYKKVVEFDPIRAPLVKEALEGFATGRFASPMEIVRFFTANGFYGDHPPQYTAKLEQVTEVVLRHILYTGFLEHKPRRISLRKGYHPALITVATYDTIQYKLNSSMSTFTRSDVREDFPLRNFVACKTCGRALTASWSRGRSKRYPYYWCYEKDCPEYGKSIPKEQMEIAFHQLLQSLEVTDLVLDVVKIEAGRAWEQKTAEHKLQAKQRVNDLGGLEADLKGLADKLAKSHSDIVSQTLEERIEELSHERARILDEIETTTELPDFGTAFERVRHILRNPLHIWESGDVVKRRLVVRLAFNGSLAYDRKTGFGTTELSLPYLISGRIANGKSGLVDITRNTWNLYSEMILDWEGQWTGSSKEEK